MWPSFKLWASENGKLINGEIELKAGKVADSFNKNNSVLLHDNLEELLPHLKDLLILLDEYEVDHLDNPTFSFWRQYMKMVGILLRFTRAVREGNWLLYLSSFAEMLPWFALYDRNNYTRWGCVFLADMRQLKETAPEVYDGFINGDFVAKEADTKFNQIPDDQALEHVNKLGKVAGGLVGITRTDSARE